MALCSADNVHKGRSARASNHPLASHTFKHTVDTPSTFETIVTKGGQSEIAYLIGQNGHFEAVPVTPQPKTDDTGSANSSLWVDAASQSPDVLSYSQNSAYYADYSRYGIAYARECCLQEIKPSEPEAVESAINLTGIQFLGIPLRHGDALKDEDIVPAKTDFTALQDYMSQPQREDPFTPINWLHGTMDVNYAPAYGPLCPSDAHSEFVPSLTTDLSSRDADSWAGAGSFRENDTVSNRTFPLPLHSPPLAIEPLESVLEHIQDSIEFEEHWLAESEKPGRPDKDETELQSEEDENEPESEEDDISDSLDSFWLSDYSDTIPKLKEKHPLMQLHRDFVLTHLLSTFDDHYRTHASPSGPRSHNTTGTTRRSSAQQGNCEQGQKRARSSDQSSLGRSSGEAVRKKSCSAKAEQRYRLWFACPFSKKNPNRHRSCYRNRLTKISYVKQHLSRHHCYPIYCTNCMATFDSQEIRDAHARSHSCEERPVIQWEAVTETQKRQLRQRMSRKISEIDQWYTIFEILFPGSPRPRTPFVDSELSEELSSFRDFATSQGPAIMVNSLIERGFAINRPSQDDELTAFNETILEDGLQAIFERYLEARASQMPPEAGATSSEPPQSFIVGRDGRSSSTTLVEERTLSDSTDDTRENSLARDGTAVMQPQVVGSHAAQGHTEIVDNASHEAPDNSGHGQFVQDGATSFPTTLGSLSGDDFFALYLEYPFD
ncbi:hypothetical protein RBB50_001233 [Rhinocladiella similis]